MEMILFLVWAASMVIVLGLIVNWFRMLLHCLRNDSSNKVAWILVLLFLNLLGGLLYRFIEYKKTSTSLGASPGA